jgi:hypothetical protein
MRSFRKPSIGLTRRDVMTIAGYVFFFSGLFLGLEMVLALGSIHYTGVVPPRGSVPMRYLIYAYQSSTFLRYSLVLMLLGHILRWRARKSRGPANASLHPPRAKGRR